MTVRWRETGLAVEEREGRKRGWMEGLFLWATWDAGRVNSALVALRPAQLEARKEEKKLPQRLRQTVRMVGL